MRFEDFASLHGLVIDRVVSGRWVRVPTTDHPKKRNGTYKHLGDIAFVQNHATATEISVWRPEGEAPKIDRAEIAKRAAEFERKQQEGWTRAAGKAAELLACAKPREHAYLIRKGFPRHKGLVLPDEALLVPMRGPAGDLVGAQLIRFIPDDLRFEKKMLPGMRAKGAVLRLGPARASKTILCEGYATGLSIEMAVAQLGLFAAVLVCFSAGNMATVAPRVKGPAMVFADHDASGAGEAAARTTGLPYCMGDKVGEDANDIHVRAGLFEVCALLLNAREAHAGR